MGNIVNSQDVLNNPSDPTQWYELRIVNNIIVNNVAANGGGGIFLQDVARATVINNTVANNDSTSTSALAFTPGQLDSNPLPAGVVSGAHSAALQALFGAGFEQTFSNPTLVNNIIWQNRSWYNDGTTTPGFGILSPNPAGLYQDLGVVFTLTPQLLNPMYCVLTDTTGYDVSNLAPADPGFVLSYLNTLFTATVLDEGGNAINVSYPELNADLGDYHINAGSPAVNTGVTLSLVTYPQLYRDFDQEIRLPGSSIDIGADEIAQALLPDTIGLVRGNTIYLRATNSSGTADLSFIYGSDTDTFLFGDWDGDGIETVGVKRGNTYYLRNGNSSGVADITFSYGASSDIPIVGDWDGDGIDTIGIKRGNVFHLRNSNSSGVADVTFVYGLSSDTVAVIGDWDGDGFDTIGIKRGNEYYLRNSNSAGPADIAFAYGSSSDIPVVGDWDGDGVDSIGIKRGITFYLRNSTTSGVADITLDFGAPSDIPIAGKWGLP
jgi:parallel beta-helix repeat protein